MPRDLDIAARRRLDSICNEFESIWSADARPDFGQFLDQVDPDLTEHLLQLLLEVDVELRARANLTFLLSDYERVHPNALRIVEQLMNDLESKDAAGVSGETLSMADGDTQNKLRTRQSSQVAELGAWERVRYFGEYELVEEIARGGMGVVFKTRQVKLNRIVALKMILSGELAGEEEVQRFKTEAEAAANLDHPGIVPIYEIGEHNGQHYFSMGFVEGQSLAHRVKDGPLPPKEAAEIVKKVCDAVAYAHENGVIHRDLKPANVLLDPNGEPKVTDFGLAKQVESDSELTRTGAVMGTPSYMPPEQASGQTDQVGPQSDVYSLGAILYCLLTGRPPFQAANTVETLFQVLRREPVSPLSLNPDIPKDLDTVCLKCLQKDAGRRYQDARGLSDELGRYLRCEPILARPLGWIGRAWRWGRRNPEIASLTLAIFAILTFSLIAVSFFAIEARWQAQEKDNALAAETKQRKKAVDSENAAVRAKAREVAKRKDVERLLRRATARDLASESREAFRAGFGPRSVLLGIAAVEATRQFGEPAPSQSVQALRSALDAMPSGERYEVGSTLRLVVTSKPARVEFDNQRGEYRRTYADRDKPGRWLAVAPIKPSVHLWDLASKPPSHRQLPMTDAQIRTTGSVVSMAISGDERWLAACCFDGAIRVWDLIAPDQKLPSVLTPSLGGGGLRSLTLGPDGRRLVAGDSRGWIHLWDLTTSNASATHQAVPAHDRSVDQLAISPNGLWLASESYDKTRIWNLEPSVSIAKSKVLDRKLLDTGGALAFSSDSTWLVSTGGPQAWNLKEQDPNSGSIVLGSQRCWQCKFDGRGKLFAISSAGLKIWDMDEVSGSVEGQSVPLAKGIQVAPERGGRAFFTASDRFVHRWTVGYDGQAEIATTFLGHDLAVTAMTLTSDRTRLITGGKDGAVQIWSLADRVLENGLYSDALLSSNWHWYYANSILWDISGDTFKRLEFPTNPEGRPQRYWLADISPDSNWLLTVDAEGNGCNVWDLSKPKLAEPRVVFATSPSDFRRIGVSAGGRWIITQDESRPNSVFAWNTDVSPSTSILLNSNLPLENVVGRDELKFSSDGRWLALNGGSGSSQFQLWELAGDKPELRLELSESHLARIANPNGRRTQGQFTTVTFSDDSRWLLVGDIVGHVARIDLAASSVNAEGRLAGESIGATSVSRSGRWVASALKGNNLWLWDTTAPSSTPLVLTGHEAEISCIAFTPNEQVVLTGGDDGTLRIWNLPTADEHHQTSPQILKVGGRVEALSVDEDGGSVRAVNSEGRIEKWDLTIASLIRTAKNRVGRELTPEEKTQYNSD